MSPSIDKIAVDRIVEGSETAQDEWRSFLADGALGHLAQIGYALVDAGMTPEELEAFLVACPENTPSFNWVGAIANYVESKDWDANRIASLRAICIQYIGAGFPPGQPLW